MMNNATNERRKIAECECSVCHAIVPKTEAVQRDSKKKSGLLRRLFRNDPPVWACFDCVEDESVVAGVQAPAGALLLGLLAFGIGWMEMGLTTTLVFLFASLWGWVCLVAFGGVGLLALYGWKRYTRHFYGSEL